MTRITKSNTTFDIAITISPHTVVETQHSVLLSMLVQEGLTKNPIKYVHQTDINLQYSGIYLTIVKLNELISAIKNKFNLNLILKVSQFLSLPTL